MGLPDGVAFIAGERGDEMNKTLPDNSQIIIVGGGIIGSSIAYHLGKFGMRDVLLLERHRLTSGSTWHAAGLIMQTRLTHTLTELARYNVELYAALEAETGQATGFKQNGTLGVARTSERLHEARRAASVAKSFGIEAYFLSAGEAADLYPEINKDLIEGAVYIPNDGQTNPVDTTMSLIAGAKQHGVTVVEDVTVDKVERTRNGEFGVSMAGGQIRCEKLVIACGLWTQELAAQLGIRVPLHPCEHMYVVTESLPFVKPTLPVLRDPDGYTYVKEDAGRLLVGSFEPRGKPIALEKFPVNQAFIEFTEDWDHFELPYSKAVEILPPLADAGVATFMNGPESFTPDLMFILGEPATIRNCFVAAGFNSEGIEFAPGVGRALAEWIIEGEPTMDLSSADINRFHPFQDDSDYLRDRAAESLGLHYKMHWPHKQREAGRPARKSALHELWSDRYASFGEAMGWERPLWFAPRVEEAVDRYSYFEPNWYAFTAEECHAARNDVVIFDQSSFGKHLIHGPDACTFLQRLCSGNVDVPTGKIVYTHMLNRRGGIETDITVNRLAQDRYLIISSATTQPRDKSWIERHLSPELRVTLTDVTSAYAVLSLQGPRSRELLGNIVDIDLSNEAFAFATSKKVNFADAQFILNRLTYIGELGWELHIPVEFAYKICVRLLEIGHEFGLKPAGYHALDHLRSECAYREYQFDLTPTDTPLEAGLGFTVKLDSSIDFIGRDALLKQRGQQPTKRLVMFRLRDPKALLFHDEIILLDGQIVGYITSGAYGFTLGNSVGMGYVHWPDGVSEDLLRNGEFTIDIGGEKYAADVSFNGFFDPRRERVRC